MKKETTLTLFVLVLFFVITPSFAQISAGGTPPSFIFETKNKTLSSTIDLPIDFDVVAMREEDNERKRENLPPRIGKIIPVDFTTENSGEWTTLPNGQKIWRLCIYAKDAFAMMLTYNKFEIPSGGKLFIYNNDRSRVLGAYTEENNPKRVEYATEFVAGDQITLEYVPPVPGNFNSPVIISGVVYGYNNLFTEKHKKGEQNIQYVLPCMINVNCEEGNNWTDQKKGVVRIITPLFDYYFTMCSGSIINNTAQDLDPLLLSASHCYEDMTTSQINQSIYYFHYEHSECEGNSSPSVSTVTGATILVDIPFLRGSDGILLRLNENIPASYGVYYNGWDRMDNAAVSGVGIHHPAGAVKKISTYSSPAESTGGYYGEVAPNSMWKISFVATQNGHGIVEVGSSGSPMFNQDKRVVGALSLIYYENDCNHLTSGYACYGKLWHYWDQYNSLQQMKTYLDPIQSGAEFIDGRYAIPGAYIKDSKRSEILIFPNPTMGELTITNYELEIKCIEIFDIYGKILSSHHPINSSTHHLINISDLSPGVYFLKIKTENNVVVKKIIKN